MGSETYGRRGEVLTEPVRGLGDGKKKSRTNRLSDLMKCVGVGGWMGALTCTILDKGQFWVKHLRLSAPVFLPVAAQL